MSVAKGLPEGQVKSIVGHSANIDTLGIYGHNFKGEQEQAAQDLDVIFETGLNASNGEGEETK